MTAAMPDYYSYVRDLDYLARLADAICAHPDRDDKFPEQERDIEQEAIDACGRADLDAAITELLNAEQDAS